MSRPLTFRSPLVLIGAAAFTLVGGYQSMFGPSYPRFLQHFDVTQASVGWIASFTFIGATSAIFSSTWLLRRFKLQALLTIALLLLAFGAIGIGLAPSWPLALLSALLAGFGAGTFSSGVNVALAREGGRGAGVLNVVNAMFGLGAVLGPLLVGSASSVTPGWPFVLVGLLALPVLFLVRRLPGSEAEPTAPEQRTPGTGRGVSLFVLLFFLYVMTEIGTGSWLATHLTPQVGVERAAALTSMYWLALTVGRLVIAPLAHRFRPQDLVTGAAVLALGAALLTNIPSARVGGYVLLGLALAPIYPTTVAWFGQRLPAHLMPIAMTGGSLGAAAVQPIVGVAVSAAGVQAIPALASLFAGGVVAVAFAIRAFQRSIAAQETPGPAEAGKSAPHGA